MAKLNTKYWVSKYDDLTETDKAAIEDGFRIPAQGCVVFTDEDKVMFAEILLGGGKKFKDPEAFSRAYEKCMRFNHEFMVDNIFYSNHGGFITVWRYNYRELIKIIPNVFIIQAIKNIYQRLGYEVNDDDTEMIAVSEQLYDCFLKNFKEEVGQRYIFVDAKQDMEQYLDASYLNMYLIFDKLGLEGRNFFEVMASIGEISPSVAKYKFETGTRSMNGMINEAKDRSRGRDYPTFYEISTVMEL